MKTIIVIKAFFRAWKAFMKAFWVGNSPELDEKMEAEFCALDKAINSFTRQNSRK